MHSNRLLRRMRFPGDLASINLYINERLFTIRPQPKLYDAVYAAQMAPYKRLHLAAEIPRLFVQTYGEYKTPDGAYDLPRFEPRVKHAHFNKGWVTSEAVVDTYNQSHVGLALSACEGAMLASVEYMLCGVPQVSTPCKGGREQFFDDRYVIVADAEPGAIAKAVRDMIARDVSPELVRNETLAKIRSHRLKLCRYVQGLIRESGAPVPSDDTLFDRWFGQPTGMSNCFVHWRNYEAGGLS
jgi:glycosyltransferase involved in cell wall biosynthesis